MIKIEILMAISVLSISIVLGISDSVVGSNAQPTVDAGNSTQSSNQGTVELDLSPPETIVQSDNLQNPSIQESLQQQQQQQQPLELESGDQQVNQGNSSLQVDQNNLPPNVGELSNLCNPSTGSCKPGY